MIYRFEPIDTWPGVLTPSYRRNSSYRFKASHDKTMRELAYELDKLNAKDIVIRLALTKTDIRLDGMPRAYAKPSHPGVVVEFDMPKIKRRVRYATDRYEVWQHNLRAITLTLVALRAVDRYGTTDSGEQYVGFQKQLTTGVNSMNLAEAHEFIRKHGGSYKAAAKRLHPDAGGSEEDFKKLEEANAVLNQSTEGLL